MLIVGAILLCVIGFLAYNYFFNSDSSKNPK